jgi:hypothetical protein
MSTIEVNKITPVSGGTTVQIGESGDTINIPSGATIANAGTATGFGLTNWAESSGNLLATNASYGIYLGVNSATAANLLNDYEEGTWSPALSNFGGSNENFIDPRYTKIGRLVTVSCQLQIGSFPSDGSSFAISGLPFTVKSGSGTTYGTVPFRQTNTSTMGLTFGGNNTVIEMYAIPSGGQFNYNDFGQSKQMAFVAQYETDS